METKKKTRIVISIVLFFIMATAIVYLYEKRDELFTSTYELTYPDRCVEVYKDDILIGEECTIGRIMYEKKLNKTKRPSPIGMPEWKINLT